MEMFYEIHIAQICVLLGILKDPNLKKGNISYSPVFQSIKFFFIICFQFSLLCDCAPLTARLSKKKEDYTMLFLKHRSYHITTESMLISYFGRRSSSSTLCLFSVLPLFPSMAPVSNYLNFLKQNVLVTASVPLYLIL